jgi:glycerol-3-phosphate acyltransferase PlsY
MTLETLLWMAGGYLAGTLPSTWLISRAVGARGVIAAARREAGEADAHVVMGERLGGGWAALAVIMDVAKGMVIPLAARRWGGLPDGWVALTGVAVVVGHGFPFYARWMAGRGLAAAAGVYLVLVPVPMVVAGLTMCLGFVIRQSGLMSTIGFGSVPLFAWIEGQPPAFVAMGLATWLLIVIRRLEGTGEVVRASGLSWPKAVWYRVAFDASGPPSARADAPEEEPTA